MVETNADMNSILEKYIEDAKKLIELIYMNPEKGFFEFNTTRVFADYLEKLGLYVKRNIVRTGCICTINFNNPGPKIAVMAELDAIKCSDHLDAGKDGYVHSCGHNLQVGTAFLIAALLVESRENKDLCGSVDIIGVPSEEYIEIETKGKLKEEKSIKYFGGKQEIIASNYLDEADISILTHVMPKTAMKDKDILIGGAGIGFIAKEVVFIGKEAHAGTSPHKGLNALSAAMLTINNINALRETFEEEKGIRVHYILKDGGETVNTVPKKVHLEMHVRSKYLEDLRVINNKVNNCINAGALAVGCNVEIIEIPGYLPSVNYESINNYCKNIAETIIPPEKIDYGSASGSANDFGDVSQLMTALKIYTSGIEGELHSQSYKFVDFEKACLLPSKIIYKTIVSLLENDGEKAFQIINDNEINLNKKEYFEILEGFSKKIEHKYMD